MKKLMLSALVVFAVNVVNAQYRAESGPQKNIFISAGFDLGIPSNGPFGISYGGSAKAEVRVARPVGITLTGGYDVYSYKSSFLKFAGQQTEVHPALIPLKAGLKYYSGPGFYAEGELGSAIKANNGPGNLFVYAIGVGFDIPTNSYSDVDIGFRYEGYSERQYQVTGIRIAYRVGW